MYSFKSRVRYSEVNKNRTMDLTSIINYFQDCSIFHSEGVGLGIDYLAKKKRVWLLNAWQINVNRYPTLGEEITTSTWPYDFKNMYGYRNFIIQDSKDEVVAYANSIWVYLDSESQRPVKVNEEEVSVYGSHEKFDMEYAPRKIEIPQNLTKLASFPVIRANIDTNNHVNNGQYIKMAEEFLPIGFQIKQMRAEYKMQAVLGDTIVPYISSEKDKCTILLSNLEGKPYAVIEFT